MEWLRLVRDSITVLFRRRRFDQELDEELQFHLQMDAEAREREGIPAAEAAAAALRRLGNTTRLREQGWYAWGWGPLERFFQILRDAIRTLRRGPGFAASVVLLLGFAIWMNTTVFSVVHAVMLAPLPFDHSEDLVRIYEISPQDTESAAASSNFSEWRAQSRSFEQMAAACYYRGVLGKGNELEEVLALIVSPGFFNTLRVKPALGRDFAPEEYARLASNDPLLKRITSAIVSDTFWRARLGSRPDAIGSTFRISDIAASADIRIVGVMPPGFASVNTTLGSADIWLASNPGEGTNRAWDVIARRRHGVSLQESQAEMDVIAGRLRDERPYNKGWGVRVADLREAVPGRYRASLVALAGAVLLVLLIACANVANLMLARGAARVREMATRAAIGAGRTTLVAQLGAEAVMMSLAAGALGFLLSLASVRAIVSVAPADVPRIAATAINLPVLGFCLAIALATGLLCGIAPALRISKFSLSAALKEGGAASSGTTRSLLTRALVALEVAMSLMLLVGAALLAKSFRTMQTMKLDFAADHVLTATLSYARIPWDWQTEIIRNRDLLDRFRAIPGVASAASGAIPPAAEFSSLYAKAGDSERRECMAGHPSLDYFNALRIPLLSGRLFSEAELDSPDVVVINETAARLTWPGEQAVGKRIQDVGAIKVNRTGVSTEQFRTVVGVVGDIPNSGLANKPRPQIYLPPLSRVMMAREGRFLLRTNGTPGAVAQAVRTAVHSYDRRITVRSVATLEDTLAPATAGLRFNTLLMTIFASLAFLLAASGVYSLMSYTVALRTREMSIRMAMGAGRSDIILLVLRTGAVMVGIGVALGFGGAFFAGRFLSSLLCQVESRDPVSFAVAAALMVCAALVACYIPARRAGSVDIIETLRQE